MDIVAGMESFLIGAYDAVYVLFTFIYMEKDLNDLFSNIVLIDFLMI